MLFLASVKVDIVTVHAELVSQAPHVKARVHEHCWQINCASRARAGSVPTDLCPRDSVVYLQKLHLVVYLCVQKLQNNIKVQRNRNKHDVSAAFTVAKDGTAKGTLTSVVVAWIHA